MKNRIQAFVTVAAITVICLLTTSHDVKADDLEDATVSTQEIIEPFGGTKWDDNLLQIIGKLSAINGIQNIHLHLSNASTDVRNVTTREDLEKTFSDLMLKYNPRISMPALMLYMSYAELSFQHQKNCFWMRFPTQIPKSG